MDKYVLLEISTIMLTRPPPPRRHGVSDTKFWEPGALTDFADAVSPLVFLCVVFSVDMCCVAWLAASCGICCVMLDVTCLLAIYCSALPGLKRSYLVLYLQDFSEPGLTSGDQYHMDCIAREMGKAHGGLKAARDLQKRSVVATGHWGCGAFKGDRELKAIIQVCVVLCNIQHFGLGHVLGLHCRDLQPSAVQCHAHGRGGGGGYTGAGEAGGGGGMQGCKQC